MGLPFTIGATFEPNLGLIPRHFAHAAEYLRGHLSYPFVTGLTTAGADRDHWRASAEAAHRGWADLRTACEAAHRGWAALQAEYESVLTECQRRGELLERRAA